MPPSDVGARYLHPTMTDAGDLDVGLRPLRDDDLDAIFDQWREREAVRMAAFTPPDPDDRKAFDRRISEIRANPTPLRVITLADKVVGTISSCVVDGDTEITYWVDRSVWGRGVASRALALFLDLETTRPLFARAASDNAASLRVLEKAGFRVVGTDRGYAPARGEEIEETILQPD